MSVGLPKLFLPRYIVVDFRVDHTVSGYNVLLAEFAAVTTQTVSAFRLDHTISG